MKTVLVTLGWFVVTATAFGAIVTKHDARYYTEVSPERSNCARRDLRAFLDNPLENAALAFGGLAVVGYDGVAVIISERTVYGIEIGRFAVICDRTVRRLSA